MDDDEVEAILEAVHHRRVVQALIATCVAVPPLVALVVFDPDLGDPWATIADGLLALAAFTAVAAALRLRRDRLRTRAVERAALAARTTD
ncbi:hypothetical protein [Amnibacterium setariae]|uniref:Uncharacterized protein n=1 Tax=Amnibacterium setariae TaxID=2306585 RepID=A0A3A1U1C0_9MICO|nr:hypothetical protein [Amnibacterium setariae]RIX28246.1 hypothetical protein D1781_12345 [Amnibacterium setariae]